MSVDPKRLQQLRDRQRQAMSADDDTIMTDSEVDGHEGGARLKPPLITRPFYRRPSINLPHCV